MMTDGNSGEKAGAGKKAERDFWEGKRRKENVKKKKVENMTTTVMMNWVVMGWVEYLWKGLIHEIPLCDNGLPHIFQSLRDSDERAVPTNRI